MYGICGKGNFDEKAKMKKNKRRKINK